MGEWLRGDKHAGGYDTDREMITLKLDLLRLENNIRAIEEKDRVKDGIIHGLTQKLKSLEPIWTYICGFQWTVSIISQTIPYSTLLYFSSNIPDAGLDIVTGVFTSGYAGTYSVSWSLTADDDSTEPIVSIYLRKNGINIDESLHWSGLIASDGGIQDQGGRSLLLHLDRGDTLDLCCQNCSAGIDYTTFCVSLVHPDTVQSNAH